MTNGPESWLVVRSSERMGYDAVRGEELEQVEQRVTKLQYGLLIVNALTLVIALANFRKYNNLKN